MSITPHIRLSQRLLVGLLMPLFYLLSLPFWWRHPKVRAGKQQRLGRPWPAIAHNPSRLKIWLHGASAGDIAALAPTVAALKQAQQNLDCWLSTLTTSGYFMAQSKSLPIFYAPYDLRSCVRRSLRCVRPDLIVIEYTELWPIFIQEAYHQNIPLVLHNGRLDVDKIWAYRALFAISGNLLCCFQKLLMRSLQEAQVAQRLGASPSTISVTGDTKYSVWPTLSPAALPDWCNTLPTQLNLTPSSLLWVVGSSHEGEEPGLLNVFIRLRTLFPQLKLLLAPRYIERSKKLVQLAKHHRLRACTSNQAEGNVDVVVLEHTGYLKQLYTLATLVFVGGSLVPRGGQNIIEPARQGKPVFFGPYMKNFSDAVLKLRGHGGTQVSNYDQLYWAMKALLSNPQALQQQGQAAVAAVASSDQVAFVNAQHILAALNCF